MIGTQKDVTQTKLHHRPDLVQFDDPFEPILTPLMISSPKEMNRWDEKRLTKELWTTEETTGSLYPLTYCQVQPSSIQAGSHKSSYYSFNGSFLLFAFVSLFTFRDIIDI